MGMKKIALISAVTLLPILAHADVVITNNTNSYVTGTLSYLCSSTAGSSGILQPKPGTLTISQSSLNYFCSSSCSVEVHLSKNCGDKSIATVTVTKDGITQINNHDTKRAIINGGGSSISVDPGTAVSIWDVLKFWK